MHRAAAAKVMVRQDRVRDGVRVEHRRREHAARARRGPPGRVHATRLAASAVEHPPAALGVQVSDRRVEVCRGGVRVVPQHGHDETGVLDGRNAGRTAREDASSAVCASVSARRGLGWLDAGSSEVRVGDRRKSSD